MTDALLDRSAGDLVALLADRKVGAVELAEAAIARIEARDGAINAVVVRDFDVALDAARAADAALSAGERRPLLGLPMTVKESHNVEGLPTTWGSPAFTGWTAPADSVAVARLKAAGAVILGKTNVPPFLSDWQAANPIYGRTSNPWDLARSPGGSSGGAAAALAAGMVPLELGSDIGGSIRVPAAFCGVYGHKPSWELIPSRGHAPPGIDGGPPPLAVVGPLARTAADLELALDVTAGPAAETALAFRLALPPARHARLDAFRILVLDQHPDAATDDEVRAALDATARRLADLGADVRRDSPRLPDLALQHALYRDMLNAVVTRGAPGGSALNVHQWMDMEDAQLAFRAQWTELFREVDIVMTPTFGTVAFPHLADDGADQVLTINGRPTRYFDQIAWPGVALLPMLPATAVPIGRTVGGLPIGAQLIGPYLEDRTPLALARLLEREIGGFTPPPAFA